MSKKSLISRFVLLISVGFTALANAQTPKGVHAQNGMNAQPHNYSYFTPLHKDADAQVAAHNKGYEAHPEIGVLFPETPCDNCYELIGDRTEMSKTFKDKGIDAAGRKKVYCQTSSMPMHYRDAAGNWRTIQAHIAPTGTAGVYAAAEQEVPVRISAADRFTAIGKAGSSFRFNNDLELIYLRPDGMQVSLGKANWSGHTAGDDGVYVKDAWPGIDIEIYAQRGMTKTNFYINHAMPAYADGKLLVRDHMQLDAGMTLDHGSSPVVSGILSIKNAAGADVFFISPATAAEKRDSKHTLQQLNYVIDGNTVDIALPGNFLNREAAAYPVIIDPLVSTATVTAVTGSTYSAIWTVPCVYNNAATVPANCTITDIQWSFNYITSGGAWLDEGAVDFRLGACRSPTGATGAGGFYWFCNLIGAGTCTGTNISIYSDISSCVPPPQCPSYNLNMVMDFYQNYLTTAPCATTYVSGATPLTITVIGHTVEINPVVVAGASTICAGQSTSLSTTALYGVAPYTFTWNPGSLSGSPVTVSPTATTTYTATVTDACGITSTATSVITVSPAPPVTGTMSVCVGGTTALGNTVGGGTWSSSATGVATVSSTGVVSGVSAGTTIITYTMPTGCSDTALVTVNLLWPITGPTNVCVGNAIALANTLSGGTWTSSNTAIATVVAASGVVSGVSAGTVNIVYTVGSGCSTSYTVTVNPLPSAISGPLAVCQGNTVVWSSTPATGTWSSSAPGIATVSGGTVGGAAPGAATITYTLPTSCYVTQNIVVNPIYSSSFNITVCAGGSYTFAGNTYTITGVYPHVFNTVAGCDSVVALHLIVSPPIFVTVYDSICIGSSYTWGGNTYSSAGAYTHTFITPLGCDSNVTLNLYIKPLPPAPLTTDIDLCQNANPVAPLTAVGANLLWYTASLGGAGSAVAPVPPVAAPGVSTWYVSQVVNGCEGPRAPLNVTVHNRPNFNIVPGKPYECQYDTISLNYGGPMFPGIQFSWTVPGYAALTGGTLADPSIILRFDTSLGSNTASLTIGDGYVPCNSTAFFNVPVFLTAPPASFTTNSYACTGDSVLVALNYTSPGINDYIWDFDGGRVVKHSSNHGGPYNIVWDNPGVYVVTLSAVTNVNCPATIVKDTIRVGDKPDAAIAPYAIVGGHTVPCTGDSLIFSPLHFNSANSYHWSPEHYFSGENVSRVYGVVDRAGYIKLTVATPFGCKNTDSMYINAQPCCIISFPTAFTPNGDTKNDVFRPIMDGHRKIHFFRIENRWGQVIYESREESKGVWDGTFNGEPQDMGVYFYYVIYDCDGANKTIKGEVTLIR